MKVQCARCGKEFNRPTWHAQRKQKHYCSWACRFPPVNIICEWCGTEKRIAPSDIREHNFCSRKCCRAWQGANGIVGYKYAQVALVCPICGQHFTRQQNQVKRNKHSYCSAKCFYQAHRTNMSGSKNPAWRGGYEPFYGPSWDRQARRARARDKHTCQYCGISEHELSRVLDVHHIKPLRDFDRDFKKANALVNLVSLCSSCHKLLEWHEDQMSQLLASWFARTDIEPPQSLHIPPQVQSQQSLPSTPTE